MARIKHTKNELKTQREALRRFERFLPMLQLKKQQLQAEILSISAKVQKTLERENAVRDGLRSWIKLVSEDVAVEDLVSLQSLVVEEGNIAGVAIPVFRDIVVSRTTPDLMNTPSWVDDAAVAAEELIRIHAEKTVLEEQHRRVVEELRTTSQRVNLFEKVKIPECRENIRVIKIFLGDEQTAAVVRGKFAKKRTAALEGSAA